MGFYNVRQDGLLTAWQMQAAHMMFQGFTDEDIAREIFRTGDDKKKISSGKTRLRKLRKTDAFMEYYRTIITEWGVHNVGRALMRLSQQIDDPNAWLANKAANDILTQSKRMVTGDDENQITVKIEGMPELGEPEKS